MYFLFLVLALLAINITFCCHAITSSLTVLDEPSLWYSDDITFFWEMTSVQITLLMTSFIQSLATKGFGFNQNFILFDQYRYCWDSSKNIGYMSKINLIVENFFF